MLNDEANETQAAVDWSKPEGLELVTRDKGVIDVLACSPPNDHGDRYVFLANGEKPGTWGTYFVVMADGRGRLGGDSYRVRPKPLPTAASGQGTAYGYCPICGAPGVTRERRPNGNDQCANGHTYPSAKAERAARLAAQPADKPARHPCLCCRELTANQVICDDCALNEPSPLASDGEPCEGTDLAPALAASGGDTQPNEPEQPEAEKLAEEIADELSTSASKPSTPEDARIHCLVIANSIFRVIRRRESKRNAAR